MSVLLLGLLTFLGVHSIRMIAEDWRAAQIRQRGEARWKMLYSAASFAGLALTAWGYALARATPVVLWTPPPGMSHLTALLTLIAFVLLVAGYVPRNAIKAAVHHPVALSGALWGAGHLIASGRLASVVLFGAFLAWGTLSFVAARGRDRRDAVRHPRGSVAPTLLALAIGAAAWAGFAFGLHGMLIGVRPLG